MKRASLLLGTVLLVVGLLSSCGDGIFGGGGITISGIITPNTDVTITGTGTLIIGITDSVPAASATTASWISGVPPLNKTPGQAVAYEFTDVPTGRYVIVAWVDLNDDSLRQADEPTGMFPPYSATVQPRDFQSNFTTANITLYVEGGGGGGDETVSISGTITPDTDVTVTGEGQLVVGIVDVVPAVDESNPTWFSLTGNPQHLTPASSVTYTFDDVPVGQYMIIAWIDLNADDLWDTNEPSGTYPEWTGSVGELYDFQATTTDADITLFAGEGGGGTELGPFTFPSPAPDVKKGYLVANPDLPMELTYLYVSNLDKDLYSIQSADGGETWGDAVRATNSSDVIDFVAAADGDSTTVVTFIHGVNLDGGVATAAWISLPWQGSTWSTPIAIHVALSLPGPPVIQQLCRIPSAFRVSGSALLFGVGYDTAGGGFGNDTDAKSLYWDGSNMSEAISIDLHGETDNPSFVQQVFGEPGGAIQYLYFDNHSGTFLSGDVFLIPGTNYTSWTTWESESIVVDVADGYDTTHAYLFKVVDGDYVLVYAAKQGAYTTHVAYAKHAGSLAGLGGATPVRLNSESSNLKSVNEPAALYHTMYATQDASGAVHVVWEDTVGAIERARIDPATYEVAVTPVDVASASLDGASSYDGALFVAVHYGHGGGMSEVIRVLDP